MGSNACDREELTRQYSINLAGESVRVGQALGFQLERIAGFDPAEWAAAMEGDAKTNERIHQHMTASAEGRSESQRPSMAQDIAKRRRTEIEFINGLVAAKGQEIGVSTPANAAHVDAVKRVERGDVEPSLDNLPRL